MRIVLTAAIAAVLAVTPIQSIAESTLLLDGQTAQIGKAADGFPCAASREKWDAISNAIIKKDKYGYAEATADAVALKRGAHVRAIDHAGFMYSLIRIRIESGSSSGAACWLPSDIKGTFVNIR